MKEKTEKSLRKLNRLELLAILVQQQERIEELESELEEARAALKNRELKISEAGSIAQASIAITEILERAQAAADLYLENVKRINCE